MPKVDVDQVMVLMPKDWERIQYELHMREIEAEKIRLLKKKKEEIAVQSKKFVENWPNTLASLRQKKIEDFKLKQRMEEEEKNQKDIEWAVYQAEVRKEVIAEAKKKMYFQTDRIKGLHRGFQFSEVLREREEQIKLNNLQRETAKMREEMSYKESLQENQEMEMMEKKKQENRKKIVMDRIDELKVKIQNNIEEKKKEKEANKQEQKHLKQLAEEWDKEVREDQNKMKAKSLKFAVQYKEQIKANAELRELQKKKQEEEDKACEAYAKAKRDMLNMRTKRNKELREQREKYLEVLGIRISNQMKKLNEDENQKIAMVVQEKETQRLRFEEQKKKNYDKYTEEIIALMKTKISDDLKKKEAERLADLEILKESEKVSAVYHRNEKEKFAKKRQDRVKLQDFHSKQKKENEEMKEEMKAEELKFLKADIEKYEAEDKNFRSYADSLMEECKKKGGNLYPIEYEAGYKHESSLKQTKKAVNMFSENKKEFGFIW